MDLIKASELVLQELSNMTDEELVLALEACEDNVQLAMLFTAKK